MHIYKNISLATLISLTLLTIMKPAFASDFNLPFVNTAGLGTVYAGWAAEADDASTAYANPAGLVRIPNQQLVISGIGVSTRSYFTGTTIPPFPPFPPQSGTATSNTGAFLPSFYYAAPINDNLVFAIGETVPFGLGTNYGKNSIARYSATRTLITDFDIGPSIGIKINNHLSIGAGFDIERLALSFNNMITVSPFIPDMESQNNMKDWGYGWHAGLLYQFTPCTRMGFNYHSQVIFHPHGDSKLFTVFAPDGDFRTTNQSVNFDLPAMAQLSLYHDLGNRWTVMGSIFYTDWSVLKQITLKNVMGPDATTIPISVPLNYHNTFDYAAGVTFKATDKLVLRTGVQLVQTPSNNQDRFVADPVGSETVVGVGAHYQQNCHLGYDIGYAHVFFRRTSIDHSGAFGTAESGNCQTASDVIGGQLTWNIT